MKYYKLTLLKDLPDINAGFSITLDEDAMKEPFRYVYKKPNAKSVQEDREYNEKVHTICEYMDNPQWVKIEFDLSKAIQIECPNCKTNGMFSYEEPEQCHSDNGVSTYYKNVGLWCPHCEHQLKTHTVYTKTEVRY